MGALSTAECAQECVWASAIVMPATSARSRSEGFAALTRGLCDKLSAPPLRLDTRLRYVLSGGMVYVLALMRAT